jgi:hypothetical protein
MQADVTPAQPPIPPVPPVPPIPVMQGGRVVIAGANSGPAAIYQALKARGRELSNQLERLQDTRGELSERLKQVGNDVDRKGIESQVADIDTRIKSVNEQIAANDQQIAQTAGIPGAVVEERPPVRQGPPDEVFAIPIVFTIFVLFPLAFAYARRIWKRTGSAGPAQIPPELLERVSRIEQAVDSVAVEVERIGEGQRFVTKLFADARQPLELPK